MEKDSVEPVAQSAPLKKEKCFACDRPFKSAPHVVHCADDQSPYVGPDCFAHIRAAGAAGWQPPKGGPRLYAKKPRAARQRHTYKGCGSGVNHSGFYCIVAERDDGKICHVPKGRWAQLERDGRTSGSSAAGAAPTPLSE